MMIEKVPPKYSRPRVTLREKEESSLKMSNKISMRQNRSQSQAPLLEELLRYTRRPLRPFHMPGHKAGLGLEGIWKRLGFPARLDLTEISAFCWESSLQAAEQLAAQFYQADRSYFLVQGASQGILCGMLGAFQPGDTVLVGRNCHLSVIHGLILGDLNPVFLEVDWVPEWGLPAGIRPDILAKALNEHPDSKGLIVTNPTYQGIANRLHTYRVELGDRTLMEDEAHGGHLGWCGLNGYDAWEDADIWVQGTHKILGSLTQTGILHLREGRIDPDRVQRCLEWITTTSPSYILLAALDSNRRWLFEKGSKLFGTGLTAITGLYHKLAEIPGVVVLSEQVLPGTTRAVDPWKLCLRFDRLGMNGFQAARILERQFRIEPEYSDLNQVTFLVAPWQPKSDWEALYHAVQNLSRHPVNSLQVTMNPPAGVPKLIVKPRLAALSSCMAVPLDEAKGEISAAVVAPYPPGIPLLVPGEVIGPREIDYIHGIRKAGGSVRGLTNNGAILIFRRNNER